MRLLRSATGSQLDPNTAWMIMRSMETLSLRMHRAADNAEQVAKFLLREDKVTSVNYLGFLEPAIRVTRCSSANAAVPVPRSRSGARRGGGSVQVSR